MMLEIRDLVVGYAGNSVLQGINLTIEPGEIVTLVGANGAGKSTLVKAVAGLLRPMGGEILFEGERIDGMPLADRIRRGLALVPEGRQVFAGMTVRENLTLGAFADQGTRDGTAAAVRHTRQMEYVCETFPVLRQRMDGVVGNFSGGQQQMLAIGRGLMCGPRLLMLDEPSLGLSPLLVGEIFQLVQRLRDQGIAILLAEQNARSALAIADRGYVIENGRVTLSGPASELLHSQEIAERYLGVGTATAYSKEESVRMARRLRDAIGA